MKYFYFSSNLNYQDNLLRYKDKSIIIYNELKSVNEKKLIKLREICKSKNIKFYIINDIKFAFKYRADGLVITSDNKSIIHNFNKRIVRIGIVHNQREYYEKKQQKCDYIFLSPIFLNKKYSVNKMLGILKFNLISLNWKIDLCALGGINESNIKKINITKASAIAFQRYITK